MEREILFCLTALQMGLTTPERLREIGKELSEKKIFSLRSELIRRELLRLEQIKTIEQAIDISVSLHNGNYKKLLSLRIYKKLVKEAFGDSISISLNGEISPSSPGLKIGAEDLDIHTVTEESPDRYNSIKDIGQGGIGRVILAFDRHTGRNIAIKELLSTPYDNIKQASTISPDEARFLREARLTAQLEHPSIIPVYEIGRRLNNSIYYTMKYVKGRTLSEIIRSCNSLNERLRYLSHFVNLCNAIAYAHSKGVIHRDIKPHNVMIGEFGETVVLDWGLAKIKSQYETENEKFANQMKLLKDAAAGKTVAGEVMGTPQYMPPEQAWGDVENIDERSDIYSLGAVLYEILTGFPPFDGDSPLEIIKAVRAYSRGEKRLVPVKEEETECPDELAAIAEKALSADKNKRYQSAVDLIDDVEAYMAGRKVSGHKYSFFSNIRLKIKRGRVAFVSSIILIFIILVALIFTNHLYTKYQNSQYRLYESNAFHLLQQNDLIGAAYFAALSEKIDKKKRRLTHLMTFPFFSPILNAVNNNDLHITSIDISPNNKYLAVGSREGTLNIYDFPSLNILYSTKTGSYISKVIFSKDSNLVATGNQDGSIKVFNLNPFSLIKIIRDFSNPVNALCFSNGGKYLAAASGPKYSYSTHCNDCSIKIYSTQDFSLLTQLTAHTRSVDHLIFTEFNKYLVSTSTDGNLIFWDIFNKREIKRISLESHISDLIPNPDYSITAITEDGKIVNYFPNKEPEILLTNLQGEYLIERFSDMIITSGGVYEEEKCKDCNIYLYKLNPKNNNYPVEFSIPARFDHRIVDLIVSKEQGIVAVATDDSKIFLFLLSTIPQSRIGIDEIYSREENPWAINCQQNSNTCNISFKDGKIVTISDENNIKTTNINNFISENMKAIFPIDDKNFIIMSEGEGLSHLNIPLKSTTKIFSEIIDIQYFKTSLDNRYQGLLGKNGDFHLFQRKGDEISDTMIMKKNIQNFAFSPDGNYLAFVKRDYNLTNQKIYRISFEEIMTQGKEKNIFTTEEEILDIFIAENPIRFVFLDDQNNIYSINKDGNLIKRYKIDNTYKVTGISPIGGHPYLLLKYREGRHLGIYSITKNSIEYYLFGHTAPILDAIPIQNKIISISTDGRIIIFKIDEIERYIYSINQQEIVTSLKKYQAIMKNLNSQILISD